MHIVLGFWLLGYIYSRKYKAYYCVHLPICYVMIVLCLNLWVAPGVPFPQRLCYIVCRIAAWLGTFGFYMIGFGQDPLFRNCTVSNWIKTFASADHAPLFLAGVRWLWKMLIFENFQPHEDLVTGRIVLCPVLGN